MKYRKKRDMVMEKSLWEQFGNIKYNGKTNVSYYNIEIQRNELFQQDANSKCTDFVKKHFKIGQKSEAIVAIFRTEEIEKDYYESERPVHTVSLYLLGLSLNAAFDDALREYLDKNLCGEFKEWYDFRYTWYLTCLYHDLAFCEEKVQHESNLQKRIFDYRLQNGKKFVTHYNKDILDKYWVMRNCDHGIEAGHILFDELYKVYAEKFNLENNSEQNELKTENNIVWRKEHLGHFAYIADAIISHNIWLVKDAPENEADIRKYREAGLEELIISGEEDRLFFEDAPLLFMLCLLDTIEPTKRFKRTPEYIMKNISVIYAKEEEKFIIKWEAKLNSEDEIVKWKNNITSLTDWMAVTVKEECISKNEITLSILKHIPEKEDNREVVLLTS